MVTYNKERTAYMRSSDFGGLWYLLPRGRTKAPRPANDGPILSVGYDDRRIDFLTEEDREMLLDAEDEGVFHMVLREVERVLDDRYFAEQDRKWKVAQQILDSYRRD